METDMQKAAEKLGAVNGLQCVVAEIGWIYEHHDELRSIRRMIAEQEASERSEKDCLWSDGCD